MELKDKNIVFYDDSCGLCDIFVRLLIKLKIDDLYFAPLHKLTYRKLIDPSFDIYDSVIFYKSSNVFIKSQAVIQILSLKYSAFKVLNIFPNFILDTIYSIIARYRKVIFRQGSCLVPNKDILDKFLD